MKVAGMKIILQHGWGFDSHMWSDWSDTLQRILPGSSVIVGERGYFGDRSVPSLATYLPDSKREPLLVICHSLGLHLVSHSMLQQCEGLVIIGSFQKFHGGTDREQKLSRTKIRRMLSRLPTDPVSVLRDFHANCGFELIPGSAGVPPASDPSSARFQRESDPNIDYYAPINTDLLLSDLEILDQCDLDVQLLRQIPKVQILHGTQDMIVPLARALDLQLSLPNSSLAVLESAQHSLPTVYMDWCVDQVLNTFAPNAFAPAHARGSKNR